MDGGVEAGVGFVVACGDSPEFFYFLEEVFDQVTPFVHALVVGDGSGPAAVGGITARAPRSFNSALSQSLSKALSPISASSEMPCSSGSTPTLSWR